MKRQNGLRLCTASMLLCLLLCGCELTNASNESSLEETMWRLEAIESIEGEVIFTPPSAENYWIDFIAPDSVEGQDHCNTCWGTYELGSEGAISFSLVCTEIACGIGYGFILSDATTYELKDGQLRISYSMRGNEGVLVHREESR